MLYKNIPTIDLHGTDKDYAEILINDFIDEKRKNNNNSWKW